ncbi:unnamed protein product, partial [Polarella glacialis]
GAKSILLRLKAVIARLVACLMAAARTSANLLKAVIVFQSLYPDGAKTVKLEAALRTRVRTQELQNRIFEFGHSMSPSAPDGSARTRWPFANPIRTLSEQFRKLSMRPSTRGHGPPRDVSAGHLAAQVIRQRERSGTQELQNRIFEFGHSMSPSAPDGSARTRWPFANPIRTLSEQFRKLSMRPSTRGHGPPRDVSAGHLAAQVIRQRERSGTQELQNRIFEFGHSMSPAAPDGSARTRWPFANPIRTLSEQFRKLSMRPSTRGHGPPRDVSAGHLAAQVIRQRERSGGVVLQRCNRSVFKLLGAM